MFSDLLSFFCFAVLPDTLIRSDVYIYLIYATEQLSVKGPAQEPNGGSWAFELTTFQAIVQRLKHWATTVPRICCCFFWFAASFSDLPLPHLIWSCVFGMCCCCAFGLFMYFACKEQFNVWQPAFKNLDTNRWIRCVYSRIFRSLAIQTLVTPGVVLMHVVCLVLFRVFEVTERAEQAQTSLFFSSSWGIARQLSSAVWCDSFQCVHV